MEPQNKMDGERKVAIIQSNYIPWKGYFDLINSVDVFILYDDVQYTKNDWRNRNKIKTHNGYSWLTIPVSTKNKSVQLICESSASDQSWPRKHWANIRQYYSKAPCWREYSSLFEKLYLDCDETLLSQINYRFITAICGILGITTKIVWSMDFQVEGDRIERLINLCKKVDGTHYFSGPAAKDYINESKFKKEGIQLSYMDYSNYPKYHQLHGAFDHEVSVIDLILNEGKDSPKFMKSF